MTTHGTFTKSGGFSDRQKSATIFSAEQEKAYQEIRKNESWRFSFSVCEHQTAKLPSKWQRRLAL
jgi:IS4 transposase